jgi:hypothetical protein
MALDSLSRLSSEVGGTYPFWMYRLQHHSLFNPERFPELRKNWVLIKNWHCLQSTSADLSNGALNKCSFNLTAWSLNPKFYTIIDNVFTNLQIMSLYTSSMQQVLVPSVNPASLWHKHASWDAKSPEDSRTCCPSALRPACNRGRLCLTLVPSFTDSHSWWVLVVSSLLLALYLWKSWGPK